MKTYYKYGNGYINIDEKNIYFTSTGNWSEIEKLTEKKVGKSKKKTGKIIMIYIFLGVIFGGPICLFLFSDRKYGIISLVIAILGGIRLKEYFSTETGPRFCIPKSKVVKITTEENNLNIEFKSMTNEPDTVIIGKVEGDMETVIREMSA
jgi:hypothetical protein